MLRAVFPDITERYHNFLFEKNGRNYHRRGSNYRISMDTNSHGRDPAQTRIRLEYFSSIIYEATASDVRGVEQIMDRVLALVAVLDLKDHVMFTVEELHPPETPEESNGFQLTLCSELTRIYELRFNVHLLRAANRCDSWMGTLASWPNNHPFSPVSPILQARSLKGILTAFESWRAHYAQWAQERLSEATSMVVGGAEGVSWHQRL